MKASYAILIIRPSEQPEQDNIIFESDGFTNLADAKHVVRCIRDDFKARGGIYATWESLSDVRASHVQHASSNRWTTRQWLNIAVLTSGNTHDTLAIRATQN